MVVNRRFLLPNVSISLKQLFERTEIIAAYKLENTNKNILLLKAAYFMKCFKNCNNSHVTLSLFVQLIQLPYKSLGQNKECYDTRIKRRFSSNKSWAAVLAKRSEKC